MSEGLSFALQMQLERANPGENRNPKPNMCKHTKLAVGPMFRKPII